MTNENSTSSVIDFDLALTKSLVPLKDMSESHLLALLETARTEFVCAGQVVFTAGSYLGEHIYLLHGTLSMVMPDQSKQQIKGRSSLLPIINSDPCPYTLIAETDSSLLRINSDKLDKMLTWSNVADYLQLNISRERDLDEDADWMMTVLKSNLFFKVPPLNVEDIFSRLTTKVVYAGDVIIRQGEIGDRCYFLKEGEAEVTRFDQGKSTLVARISVGRCFGEDALVNDAPRNASITMRTDGVLMSLDKQDFYRLLKEPAVASLALQDFDQKMKQGCVCVDVRTDEEYSQRHLPSAVNIPLNLLAIKSRLLNRATQYIFYCDTGRRSRAAAHLLAQQGYQTLALHQCDQLFNDPAYAKKWEENSNYLLRDGKAVVGS
jgi:CRP-like cAMP-binding protein